MYNDLLSVFIICVSLLESKFIFGNLFVYFGNYFCVLKKNSLRLLPFLSADDIFF